MQAETNARPTLVKMEVLVFKQKREPFHAPVRKIVAVDSARIVALLVGSIDARNINKYNRFCSEIMAVLLSPLITFFPRFVARFELDEGYPTLMFFKNDDGNSRVVHRGPQDVDTLMAFIYEQMGRGPTTVVVIKHTRG